MNKTDKFAELFNDADIDDFIDTMWDQCCEKDCDTCPRRDEVEKEVCYAGVAYDLWRKLHNAKL